MGRVVAKVGFAVEPSIGYEATGTSYTDCSPEPDGLLDDDDYTTAGSDANN